MTSRQSVTMFFVRHGETYLNRYSRMQGWADAPLTEQGIRDVKLCAQKLKNEPIDAIYSSDLGRTLHTAKIIRENLELLRDNHIRTLSGLRESFFGSFEGEHSQEVYRKIAERREVSIEKVFELLSYQNITDTLAELDSFQEAEDFDAFSARITATLTKIVSQAEPGASLVIVTHGNVIRNMVNHIDDSINTAIEIHNSSITKVEYCGDQASVIYFNK